MHSDLFSKIQDEKGRIYCTQKNREGPHPKPYTEKNTGNLSGKKNGNRELFDHRDRKSNGEKSRLRATGTRIRKFFGTVKNRKGALQHGSIFLIHLYQTSISPSLPRMCRFYPSCSEYSIQAIDHYGFLRGMIKSVCRILKCHPFHPGGYDPLT